MKLKVRWWSLRNWLRGYAWGPVERCRECGHTTPFHYSDPPCSQGKGQ